MLKKLPVLVVVLMALIVFKGQAQAVEFRTVKLIINGAPTATLTTQSTVGEFLEEQGVVLHEKDKINIELNEKLFDGKPIIIEQAFDITIFIDGNPKIVKIAPESKVGNLTADLKKETGNEYYHDYPLGEPITLESELKFYTTTQKTVVEEEVIEYETEIIQTDELYEGEVKVVSVGEKGIKEISYMVVYKFDVESSRVMTDTKIIKEPVNHVELHGTKPEEEDLSKPPVSYVNKLTMRATGYSADYECTGKNPGHPYYGMTATGIRAYYGVVAVDPDVIPLGTKLYVEGYGHALAADTGSGVNGQKIDLFFESLQEARAYGNKTLEVYILE